MRARIARVSDVILDAIGQRLAPRWWGWWW